LLILATAYYAFHVFPPGNAEPLQPSSYAVVRGMGNFPSDHIIISIEWRNSGGQPTIIRNLRLFLVKKSDNSSNLSEKEVFELAGEFTEDFSSNIGYVGESYTLKQAYIIDPKTITQTFMVFHIKDWWDEENETHTGHYNFKFNKSKIKYEIILNYSYQSFSDIFGIENSGSFNKTIIPEMLIRTATVNLSEDNRWDSYSTYIPMIAKSCWQF
jgi:hypothetical protein